MNYLFARAFITLFRVVLTLIFVPSILVTALALCIVIPHVWKNGITDQLFKGEIIAPAAESNLSQPNVFEAFRTARTSDVPTAVAFGGMSLAIALVSALSLALLDVIRAVIDTALQTRNLAALEGELLMLRCYALSQMKSDKDWDAMAGNLTGVDQQRLVRAGWQKTIAFRMAEKRIESR